MNMDTRLLDEKNEQDIKEAGKILRRGGLVLCVACLYLL